MLVVSCGGRIHRSSLVHCVKTKVLWELLFTLFRMNFEGEELSIQRLKSSFVCCLWSEAKGCIDR